MVQLLDLISRSVKGVAGDVHTCRDRFLMVVLETHRGEQDFEDGVGLVFSGSRGQDRWKAADKNSEPPFGDGRMGGWEETDEV